MGSLLLLSLAYKERGETLEPGQSKRNGLTLSMGVVHLLALFLVVSSSSSSGASSLSDREQDVLSEIEEIAEEIGQFRIKRDARGVT